MLPTPEGSVKGVDFMKGNDETNLIAGMPAFTQDSKKASLIGLFRQACVKTGCYTYTINRQYLRVKCGIPCARVRNLLDSHALPQSDGATE